VNTLNECVGRLKQQKSIMINDTIVSELQEVKEMLDQKSKQIQMQEK
jgi:rRNA-processing protein FCF1